MHRGIRILSVRTALSPNEGLKVSHMAFWHTCAIVRTALSPNEGLKVVDAPISEVFFAVRTALSPNEGLKGNGSVVSFSASISQNSAKPE